MHPNNTEKMESHLEPHDSPLTKALEGIFNSFAEKAIKEGKMAAPSQSPPVSSPFKSNRLVVDGVEWDQETSVTLRLRGLTPSGAGTLFRLAALTGQGIVFVFPADFDKSVLDGRPSSFDVRVG